MAFTISIDQHKEKRRTLNPCFSKLCVSNMEDTLYNELGKVVSKIKEYERKGEQVPIAELLYCYTVSSRTLENLRARAQPKTGRYHLQPFPRTESQPYRGCQLHRAVGRDAIFHQGYLDGCPLFLHPLHFGRYPAMDVGVPQWHLCRCDLGESLYVWALDCT